MEIEHIIKVPVTDFLQADLALIVTLNIDSVIHVLPLSGIFVLIGMARSFTERGPVTYH
jgi:hypothetical protein